MNEGIGISSVMMPTGRALLIVWLILLIFYFWVRDEDC